MDDIRYVSKEEALKAVKQDGIALYYASEELRADKDIQKALKSQDSEKTEEALSNMSLEQLTNILDKNNASIKANEELIKRILEQQQVIKKQEEQIQNLRTQIQQK